MEKSYLRMVFDATLAVVVGLVGFIVYGIKDDLANLRKEDVVIHADVSNIKERLPIEYIRSDRYSADIAELKKGQERVLEKLDELKKMR